MSTFVNVYMPWLKPRYATGKQVAMIPRFLESVCAPYQANVVFSRKLTRQVIYRYGPIFVWRPHNDTLGA